MTGPKDPAAAGRDRLRAGHADREQVIEALKDAFVRGRLTRDELDVRAAAIGIMIHGVGTAVEQRRSRGQLPPQTAWRSPG